MEDVTFSTRLRKLRDNNGWTTAEMSYRSNLPKRSLEKYMLRDGASLPGYDALVSMAKGFGVSLDWLVFGSDAAGEIIGLIVERCATEISQQIFEALMAELIANERPLLKNGEILNLTVEEWAYTIGHEAAELARQLAEKGVTTEELKLWQTSRKDILVEIINSRFQMIKSGKRIANEKS